ncbi:hypothetical protein ZPR_0686 [Zunongwangia profunda SM-A87]|uniref:Uncharacterized protein n=1 Tax=Zunongwangia profunda (strain DSM 18752 / CCTCC AB 206139 / SM-A87) TaxID=655815 RepID=D5BG82_ZUNPS|nr:hypothetical protein ZPR_0686 [Zunongwangia profunda SM-A87]
MNILLRKQSTSTRIKKSSEVMFAGFVIIFAILK